MIQNRTRSDEDMKVSIPMVVSACGRVSQLVKHRDTFCLRFKQEMTGSIDSSLLFVHFEFWKGVGWGLSKVHLYMRFCRQLSEPGLFCLCRFPTAVVCFRHGILDVSGMVMTCPTVENITCCCLLF